MFSMAGGNVQKHKDGTTNYAMDGTTLVLLNGFELKTQPFVSKASSMNQQQKQQQNVQQQQQAQQQQPQQQQVQQQPQQATPVNIDITQCSGEEFF